MRRCDVGGVLAIENPNLVPSHGAGKYGGVGTSAIVEIEAVADNGASVYGGKNPFKISAKTSKDGLRYAPSFVLARTPPFRSSLGAPLGA
jgi:hypothetical protein